MSHGPMSHGPMSHGPMSHGPMLSFRAGAEVSSLFAPAIGPNAIAALAERVRKGRFALHDLLSGGRLETRFLEGSELAVYGSPEVLFLNLNTPADLARHRRVTCEPNPTKIH